MFHWPLFIAALTGQAASPPDLPGYYTCSVPVELDGLRGGMWRHFNPGHADEFYVIQLYNPAVPSGPFALWSVDNRPPAPPRDYGFQTGRREADAFRLGPDYISFGEIEHGGVVAGRLWVRLFGDDVYAGVFLRQTARRTRAARRRGERTLSVSVTQIHYPEIVARLATAREWRAVLVDEGGHELGSRTLNVPAPPQVKAAFERGRAELLSHRQAFIAADGAPSPGAPCEIIDEGL